MIGAAKAWAKRHWPRLRLRTVLFITLFTVAAMPGVAAMFLRVYENTLVRQTEAELVAQGAALAATAVLAKGVALRLAGADAGRAAILVRGLEFAAALLVLGVGVSLLLGVGPLQSFA